MRHTICNKTGALTLIPESDDDTELLFHLMDCSDLSQFTDYLQTFDNVSHHPFTTDLGVSGTELLEYPAPCLPYDGGVKIWNSPLPYKQNRILQEYVGDTIGFLRG